MPLESCLCSWAWLKISQVPAPSAGVHSPCRGVDEIPCPSVCQILLSLCSSKSNIQWTFHPQTSPRCNANFAVPSHNLTFSRYSGLFWSFFFYFLISPLTQPTPLVFKSGDTLLSSLGSQHLPAPLTLPTPWIKQGFHVQPAGQSHPSLWAWSWCPVTFCWHYFTFWFQQQKLICLFVSVDVKVLGAAKINSQYIQWLQ